MYAVCPARAVWTSRGAASSVCVRTDACRVSARLGDRWNHMAEVTFSRITSHSPSYSEIIPYDVTRIMVT